MKTADILLKHNIFTLFNYFTGLPLAAAYFIYLFFFTTGPRKRGEGCDDENQGILAAEETHSGGARLRVTLLAAGFVIGEPKLKIKLFPRCCVKASFQLLLSFLSFFSSSPLLLQVLVVLLFVLSPTKAAQISVAGTILLVQMAELAVSAPSSSR